MVAARLRSDLAGWFRLVGLGLLELADRMDLPAAAGGPAGPVSPAGPVGPVGPVDLAGRRRA